MLITVTLVAVALAATPSMAKPRCSSHHRARPQARTVLATDIPRTRQPTEAGQPCGWEYTNPTAVGGCLENGVGPTSAVDCAVQGYALTAAMERALGEECREPIPEGASDISGIWQAFSSPQLAIPTLPTELAQQIQGLIVSGFFQNIEQCGYRTVIAGRGARHDGWSTGSWAGAMYDYAGPYTSASCDLGAAIFSYEPLELASRSPLAPQAFYDAGLNDLHQVAIQNADGSPFTNYAHRFRIDCPANIQTLAFPFMGEASDPAARTACMRVVIGLFSPVPIVVDSVRVGNANDYADCRPQDLDDICAIV